MSITTLFFKISNEERKIMTNPSEKGLDSRETPSTLQLRPRATSSRAPPPPGSAPPPERARPASRKWAGCCARAVDAKHAGSCSSVIGRKPGGRAAGCGPEYWWGGPGWRQAGAPRWGLASPPAFPLSGRPRPAWSCSGACTLRRPAPSRSFLSWWSRRYGGRPGTRLEGPRLGTPPAPDLHPHLSSPGSRRARL